MLAALVAFSWHGCEWGQRRSRGHNWSRHRAKLGWPWEWEDADGGLDLSAGDGDLGDDETVVSLQGFLKGALTSERAFAVGLR